MLSFLKCAAFLFKSARFVRRETALSFTQDQDTCTVSGGGPIPTSYLKLVRFPAVELSYRHFSCSFHLPFYLKIFTIV